MDGSFWQRKGDRTTFKLAVLDDDPTGIQTVHGVYVYTDWELSTIREAFGDENQLFYILTNSRSFAKARTEEVHRTIASRLLAVSRETGIPFLVILRGDSTLRGHYLLEPEVMERTFLQEGLRTDGEIICPAFFEGGRFTKGNIHYVEENGSWIPAAQTEFAKDTTFGYRSSHLGEYVEEKAEKEQGTEKWEENGTGEGDGGAHRRLRKEDCLYISTELLESDPEDTHLEELLETACGGRKIIVNAVCYTQLNRFALAFWREIERGKYFTVRCAASLVKAVAGICTRPLLTGRELLDGAELLEGQEFSKPRELLAVQEPFQGRELLYGQEPFRGGKLLDGQEPFRAGELLDIQKSSKNRELPSGSPYLTGQNKTEKRNGSGTLKDKIKDRKGPGKGGLIIAGSHVQKTTRQLKELGNSLHPYCFIEFRADAAREEGGLKREAQRAGKRAAQAISWGRDAVIYTSRNVLAEQGREKSLELSVRISEALTEIVRQLQVRPAYIIAKGGITSSDVGVKGLGVKKALVLGQAAPGVPVWLTGSESRFPFMPYIIFPGNVGTDQTLRQIADGLAEARNHRYDGESEYDGKPEI